MRPFPPILMVSEQIFPKKTLGMEGKGKDRRTERTKSQKRQRQTDGTDKIPSVCGTASGGPVAPWEWPLEWSRDWEKEQLGLKDRAGGERD